MTTHNNENEIEVSYPLSLFHRSTCTLSSICPTLSFSLPGRRICYKAARYRLHRVSITHHWGYLGRQSWRPTHPTGMHCTIFHLPILLRCGQEVPTKRSRTRLPQLLHLGPFYHYPLPDGRPDCQQQESTAGTKGQIFALLSVHLRC